MRQNGIPQVFQQSWPIQTSIDYPDLTDQLLWSSWGTFNTENIHCYTEDYRFEIAWRKPELSLKRVLDLDFITSPDFTVYQDAPAIVNRWQLYRSLAVFSYWQCMGVRVIPSINWVSPSQIQNDHDLYPAFNTIAVRCPGKDYLTQWIAGAEHIKQLIRPETVLHFGTRLGSDIWSDSRVFQYSLRPKIHQRG